MAGIPTLKLWFENFISILSPNLCLVCGESLVAGETGVCMHCLAELPRTDFHTESFNTMHQQLALPAKIDRAAAWFHYVRTNPYAKLIQHAKYNNRPDMAIHLARLYASEILETGFFDGIDVIVPVPMWCLKKFNRGYNQAEKIAHGLSEVTGLPIENNVLYARLPHTTQTHFTAMQRMKNIGGVYGVRNANRLAGKHILIVDDVFTTGATLRECAAQIHREAPTATVSVLTLAATRLL